MHSQGIFCTGFPLFVASCCAQKLSTLLPEIHPILSIQACTAPEQCTTLNTAVTFDANWRWIHTVDNVVNCFEGNEWRPESCPDPMTCLDICALEGTDYPYEHGIITTGDALTLKHANIGSFIRNVASRVFLMASDIKYQMFSLLNQKFTFDVDVSKVPCGLNGALYLTAMHEDGGTTKYPSNTAGAKYGAGYCDSKYPRNLKSIDGQVRLRVMHN